METELTTIPIQCSCGYTWPYGGHAEVACCPKCGNKNKISTHRTDDLRRSGKRGPGAMGAELKALSRQLDDAKDQIWGLCEEKDRLRLENNGLKTKLMKMAMENGALQGQISFLESHIDQLNDEIQRLKNINHLGGMGGRATTRVDEVTDKLLADAYDAMIRTPPENGEEFTTRQLETAQNVARVQRDKIKAQNKRIAELETRIRQLEGTN